MVIIGLGIATSKLMAIELRFSTICIGKGIPCFNLLLAIIFDFSPGTNIFFITWDFSEFLISDKSCSTVFLKVIIETKASILIAINNEKYILKIYQNK